MKASNPACPPGRWAARTAGALLLAAAVAIGSGCAPGPLKPGETRVVLAEALGPFDSREACLRLVVGDRLDYEWTSTQPVAFNIYYVEGNVRLAPIVREDATADLGVFAPRLPTVYCLNWEAGPIGAIYDYRIRLRGAPR